LVDQNEPILKWLLYRIPKVICAIVGIASILLLVLDYFQRLKLSNERKAGLITFVITIICYPALVSVLKDLIRQPCPRDVLAFGGHYAGTMWDYFVSRGENRCFPGAHASAPFSFLALSYVIVDKANRGLFLFVVLPIAFFIGFYQVAKGAHYVSDTVFTAAFAWVFISCVHKFVLKAEKKAEVIPLFQNPFKKSV
jgi:membrane-associated PAP2 superfamily phosphatase